MNDCQLLKTDCVPYSKGLRYQIYHCRKRLHLLKDTKNEESIFTEFMISSSTCWRQYSQWSDEMLGLTSVQTKCQ